MAKRLPHHPPDPGLYSRPWTDVPRPIQGQHAIAGFGSRAFYVARIERALACDMVLRHHYSRRIVNNSYVHLGLFIGGALVGVLQFGYALMPARTDKVVAGSTAKTHLELNRMWLSDEAPRNSESKALSYALRYIRLALPHVRWVQSFADERCGRLGVVYQAANFKFVGEHRTTFYTLDGETYHDMLLTAHKKGGKRGAYLRANIHRAERHSYRQFRYVFFLHKGAERHLRLRPRPYPKPQAAGQSGRAGDHPV